MGKPFISVIIPTYNSEKFILDTLNSVFAQTYDNFEIIVSDDGSLDMTRDIVRRAFAQNNRIKTRLIENHHGGAGWSRNQGILSATGDWIAFLDSDDLWHKNKLSKVVENINQRTDIDLWCHNETMKIKDKEIILDHYGKFNPNINQFLSIYRENALSTSTVTLKKELLFKSGLFYVDKSLPLLEDFELWLRLAALVRIGYIKEVLGIYVMRQDSMSYDAIKTFKSLMRIKEKHHQALKNITKFYFIEEIRYTGRAFTATGAIFISQKTLLRGLLFLTIGILCWPFRFRFIKSILKNQSKILDGKKKNYLILS